ncbi:MAG: hypothetical protein M0R06_14825 [Sphaerochaeta sp.]|jgi:hypothetical protein|nr:hypothetical protein [Sphaerochaeta sp.]
MATNDGPVALYTQLPECVDERGHKFSVGPSRIPVCERCGLTRGPVSLPDPLPGWDPYHPPQYPYYGNRYRIVCCGG